ncbi:hypothetical protein [Streptomyces cahuitamycinicus]|uniref:hypothetical protein n=1 Tax=Streptomyces cahuitamycinicus TaxID=2070367 RepID=UPI0015E138A2|nr:hypothetical protein [Streptomyces cahuitamycinicus]
MTAGFEQTTRAVRPVTPESGGSFSRGAPDTERIGARILDALDTLPRNRPAAPTDPRG